LPDSSDMISKMCSKQDLNKAGGFLTSSMVKILYEEAHQFPHKTLFNDRRDENGSTALLAKSARIRAR